MSIIARNNIQTKTLVPKVGSVATIEFHSWMNESAVIPVSKAKRTRGNKEILPANKIFAECAKIISDPFWIEKFSSAATGKFPLKFYFNEETLSYRKGSKHFTQIVSRNPHEAAPACIKFFQTNGSIFSPMDEQYAIDVQHARIYSAANQERLTWESASKKVQECLVSNYVMDMKANMSLTSQQVEQLRQTIKTGLFNKIFCKTNIRLENNRIHSIEGLYYDGTGFFIDPNMKPVTTRSYTKKKDTGEIAAKDTIPQFGNKWNKYTDTLEKKILLDMQKQTRLINTSYSFNTEDEEDEEEEEGEEDDYI